MLCSLVKIPIQYFSLLLHYDGFIVVERRVESEVDLCSFPSSSMIFQFNI